MIEEGGQPGSNMLFGIYLADQPKVGANGSHTLRYRNNEYFAAFGTEQGDSVEYYHGPVLNPEALEHEVITTVPKILSRLIVLCREKLQQRVSRE